MEFLERDRSRGFVAVEILAIISMLVLLAGIALPTAAQLKARSFSSRCLHNHKQLAHAWQLYSEENDGKCANNFTIPDTQATIVGGKFENWANNVMSWAAGSGLLEGSVTNELFAAKSTLHPFTGGDIAIYRCPSDTFLSPAQRQRSYQKRVRSISMNTLVGRPAIFPTQATERSWAFGGAYRQFLKVSDIPAPARTWLTLDEHPDSINDGFYINDPAATSWGDLPGTLHAGSTPFSFADGHVELRSWHSATSKYRVIFRYPNVRPFDAAGRKDFAWYLEHSGFVRY